MLMSKGVGNKYSFPEQKCFKTLLKTSAHTPNRWCSYVAKCHGKKLPKLQTDTNQMWIPVSTLLFSLWLLLSYLTNLNRFLRIIKGHLQGDYENPGEKIEPRPPQYLWRYPVLHDWHVSINGQLRWTPSSGIGVEIQNYQEFFQVSHKWVTNRHHHTRVNYVPSMW